LFESASALQACEIRHPSGSRYAGQALNNGRRGHREPLRLAMNPRTRIGHLQRLHRAVGGTIIEHDQPPILICLAQNTFNGKSQVGTGVEDWNEDTELGEAKRFG
jgi:hypothetical protein